MFRELKKITARVTDPNSVPDGKIPVGEFCNSEKADWLTRYQRIIDQKQQRKEV
jgi:hypothetical protein